MATPALAHILEGGAHVATVGGDFSLPTTGIEEMVVDAAEANVAATAEGVDLPAVLGAREAPLLVAPAPSPPEVGAPRTLRRSSRNAGKADEHTLLKVERMAKKKNLEGNFFSSFSDSLFITNLGRIGINLATSDVAVIKNLEVDRLVLCANKKVKVNSTNLITDDEREERLEEVLNHACGNLNESLLDA
jgi:hypothetical protein